MAEGLVGCAVLNPGNFPTATHRGFVGVTFRDRFHWRNIQERCPREHHGDLRASFLREGPDSHDLCAMLIGGLRPLRLTHTENAKRCLYVFRFQSPYAFQLPHLSANVAFCKSKTKRNNNQAHLCGTAASPCIDFTKSHLLQNEDDMRQR